MQAVASHKSENRMSLSAVAACMAPLILRPLVAGNCEIENGFDLSGNGSLQLLKAAAAANHAQAIVITLLEEFGSIFEVSSILVRKKKKNHFLLPISNEVISFLLKSM